MLKNRNWKCLLFIHLFNTFSVTETRLEATYCGGSKFYWNSPVKSQKNKQTNKTAQINKNNKLWREGGIINI